MKALLVVDVDEKHMLLECNDLYDRMKGRKCTLVRLPEKKEAKIVDSSITDYIKQKLFADGWNACLEEILDETV